MIPAKPGIIQRGGTLEQVVSQTQDAIDNLFQRLCQLDRDMQLSRRVSSANGIHGSGTHDYLARFNTATTIRDSHLLDDDTVFGSTEPIQVLGAGIGVDHSYTDKFVALDSVNARTSFIASNTYSGALTEAAFRAVAGGARELKLSQYSPSKAMDKGGLTDTGMALLNADNSNGMLINVEDNYPLIFGTNNTERARLTGGGNFAIGTTDPGTHRLYVNGNTFMPNDSSLYIGAALNGMTYVSSSALLQFLYGNTPVAWTHGDYWRHEYPVGIGADPTSRLHIHTTTTQPTTVSMLRMTSATTGYGADDGAELQLRGGFHEQLWIRLNEYTAPEFVVYDEYNDIRLLDLLGGAEGYGYARINKSLGVNVSPTQSLDISGQIRIRGGSPAAGRVLTSDVDGVGTWTALSGIDHGSLGGLSDDDHTQYILANGTRAFSAVVSGVTPTLEAHLATKAYVDSMVSGLSWLAPVLDKDLSAPPGSPTTGDRYIVHATGTGAWSGHDNDIAEYNGSGWDFTDPASGQAVLVTDESSQYSYNGSSWILISSSDHGALGGLADDDHTQYLLASGSRGLSGNWDAGSYEIRAQTFQSDVATGTAPLTIASTTAVSNLNADLLDGSHASAFAAAAHDHYQLMAHDGSPNPAVYVDDSGYLGVGRTDPSARIDSIGTIRVTGSTTPTSGAGMELSYGRRADCSDILSYDRTGAAYKGLVFTGSSFGWNVSGGGSDTMVLTATGLGILQVSPKTPLHLGNSEQLCVYVDQSSDTNTYHRLLGFVSSNNGDLHIRGSLAGHTQGQGKCLVDIKLSGRDGFLAVGSAFGTVSASDIVAYYNAPDAGYWIYLKTTQWALVNIDISATGGASTLYDGTTVTPTGSLTYTLSTNIGSLIKMTNSGDTYIPDNSTYWIGTTPSGGIGYTSSTALLKVYYGSTPVAWTHGDYWRFENQVGIGIDATLSSIANYDITPKLQISANPNPGILFYDAGAPANQRVSVIAGDAGGLTFGKCNDDGTGYSSLVKIDPTAGDVGLGLTAPASRLHIHTTTTQPTTVSMLRLTSATTGYGSGDGVEFQLRGQYHSELWVVLNESSTADRFVVYDQGATYTMLDIANYGASGYAQINEPLSIRFAGTNLSTIEQYSANAAGPVCEFRKSRSAVLGTLTNTDDEDVAGAIVARIANNSAWHGIGKIEFVENDTGPSGRIDFYVGYYRSINDWVRRASMSMSSVDFDIHTSAPSFDGGAWLRITEKASAPSGTTGKVYIYSDLTSGELMVMDSGGNKFRILTEAV